MDKTRIITLADEVIVKDPQYRRAVRRAVLLHKQLERRYPQAKQDFNVLCDTYSELAMIAQDTVIDLLTNPAK